MSTKGKNSALPTRREELIVELLAAAELIRDKYNKDRIDNPESLIPSELVQLAGEKPEDFFNALFANYKKRRVINLMVLYNQESDIKTYYIMRPDPL
jgi:hypothetical protein